MTRSANRYSLLDQLKQLTVSELEYGKARALLRPLDWLHVPLNLVKNMDRVEITLATGHPIITLRRKPKQAQYKVVSNYEYMGYVRFVKDKSLIRTVTGELKGIKVKTAKTFVEGFEGEYTALALGSFIMHGFYGSNPDTEWPTERQAELRGFFAAAGVSRAVTVRTLSIGERNGELELDTGLSKIVVRFKPGPNDYVHFE